MNSRIIRKLKKRAYACVRPIDELTWPRRVRGKQKIFCIGRNKTGTTSLAAAFRELGYIVGNQVKAERLTRDYCYRGEFEPIIEYCHTAQVFQDVPFSVSGTYRWLDEAFPGSKFILTIRDSPEQWYRSVTSFQAKKWGTNGQLPTLDELRKASASYRVPGLVANPMRRYGTPENDPYNKEIMTAHYDRHNGEIQEYFSERPDDLLVLNLSWPDAYQRFIAFLGIETSRTGFPWKNKT